MSKINYSAAGLQSRAFIDVSLRKFSLGLVILFTFSLVGVGQTDKAKVSKPDPYSLRISKSAPFVVSLKAQETPLPEIASDLAVRLKIHVLVGPSLRTRKVTTEFKQLMFEAALQHLAPQVYIDYEVSSTMAQPRPVGIYLNGYDDPAPAINAVVPNNSYGLLIEGNTLDGVETSAAKEAVKEDEQPLRVRYEKNVLTVKAKKQSLLVVLSKIATELGIPFESKGDSAEIVDLDINQVPVEQALQQLSPLVHVYLRANLQLPERRPFRIVLVAPEKSPQADTSQLLH